MSIFNSLGSNYDLRFVFQALFTINNLNFQVSLKKFLEKRYGGKVFLLYKGREALELALRIIDLPNDSHIAINGFTCFAVYRAIENAGYKVSFLDINSKTLNFTSETLLKNVKSNSKIKVVIVQNTLGTPCEIEEVSKICKEYNLILIEDLAHCIGTRYTNGQEAGVYGDLVTLSFSQDKMIDAVSGGALVVRNKEYQTEFKETGLEVTSSQQTRDRFYPLLTFLIRRTYSLGFGRILHFFLKRLDFLTKPMNEGFYGLFALPYWYCHLIRLAFDNFKENLEHRKKIAQIYAQQVNKKLLSEKIVKLIPNAANLRFPIFVEKREDLINFLKKQEIHVSDIWYDAPVSPKRYLSKTSYQNQCFQAEDVASKIVNLPTHKNVTEEDAKKISNLVNLWLKSH